MQKILSYIYAWWILKTDCDGFRVDTVKHVNMEFWEYFTPYIQNVCKSIGKNNFMIFGEVWSVSDTLVGKYSGTKNNPSVNLFNSLTYFPMYDTLIDVFKKQGATNLITQRRSYLSNYDATVQDKLITFIDNHDMDRFLGRPPLADTSVYTPANSMYYPHFKLAYIFMSFYPCIPCIYYGTEQGFDGYKLSVDYGDGYVREDMWDGNFEFGQSVGDNFNQSHQLYQFIRSVNTVFDTYTFIKAGTFNELYAVDTAGIYAFTRSSGDSQALIVLNNSDNTINIPLTSSLPAGAIYKNIFDFSDTITVGINNNISVSAANMNYKIYVRTF